MKDFLVLHPADNESMQKWGASFPGAIKTKQASKCYSAALDTRELIREYFEPLMAADNADIDAPTRR
jgi:hypothetical protein